MPVSPSTSLAITHRNDQKIRAVDINEDKTRAVIAGYRTLKILRLVDEPLQCTEARNVRDDILNQDWSRRNTRAISPNTGRLFETYDLTGAQRDLFDIEDVAWSNGEHRNYIATAVRNGEIALYDLARPGLHVTRYKDHLRQVHTLSFNPHDGRYLLSGSQDGHVKLWDLRVSRPATTFPGRGEAVRDVQWSPTDAFAFAFGTDNGTMQHWSIKDNKQAIRKRSAHDKTCSSIDWHPDGHYLASAGHDHTVKIWDMAIESQSRTPLLNFRTPQQVQNVRWRPVCYSREPTDFSKQSTQLATSYREHPFIHVWDMRRPFLPFRELCFQANTSTTDMAWRSKDLLLAVGPQGDFQQYDIPFAMKPVDRHPRALVSHAHFNELIITSEKRKTPRTKKGKTKIVPREPPTTPPAADAGEGMLSYLMKLSANSHPSTQRSRSQSHVDRMRQPSMFARTPEDDGVDERFLGAEIRRKRSNSVGSLPRHSFSSTPPEREIDLENLPVQDLSKTLKSYKPFKNRQKTFMVKIPGMATRGEYQYIAQNSTVPPLVMPADYDHGEFVKQACVENAETAKRANQWKDGKTWDAVGFGLRTDAEKGGKLILGLAKDDALDNLPHCSERPHRKQGAAVVLNIADVTYLVVPPVNEMLSKLLEYYASTSQVAMGVNLMSLILPALPDDRREPLIVGGEVDEDAIQTCRSRLRFAGIPYAAAEAMLVRHEQDLRNRALFVEAAYVRKVAYEHFPAAFAFLRQDRTISIRCNSCRAPINNAKDKTVCESCGAKTSCSYCWMKESPFALPGHAEKTARSSEDPEGSLWTRGTRLWNWCPQCGHCIHAACAEVSVLYCFTLLLP